MKHRLKGRKLCSRCGGKLLANGRLRQNSVAIANTTASAHSHGGLWHQGRASQPAWHRSGISKVVSDRGPGTVAGAASVRGRGAATNLRLKTLEKQAPKMDLR